MTLLRSALLSVAVLAAFAACGASPELVPPPPAPPEPGAEPGVATAAPTTAASGAPSASALVMPPKHIPVLTYPGMKTPESVLHDAAADRYLVSNIAGKPLEADNNGFVSVLSPEGKVVTEKWIEGGKGKVTLNAPKGSAIQGTLLYVADIDTVRTFDAKSGAPKGEVKIEGATFLNDVVATPDGSVWVSDSGVKVGGSGFEPSGTDAVYRIDKTNKVKAVIKSPDLAGPNGLLPAAQGGVWVTTYRSNEIFRVDDKGVKQDVNKLPKGSLDGIVQVGDTMLVASWDAASVYRGKPGGTFEAVLTSLDSPADIGWDGKRSRLLVPVFDKDVVEVYEVE